MKATTTLLSTLLLLAIITFTGCKITGHIERKQYNSKLQHVPRDIVKQQQEASYNAVKARFDQDTLKEKTDLEDKQSIFDPANFQKDLNGKLVASIQAQTVSVVSSTRVLAERDGKVEIDFIITMPKELQGASQNIVITPQLHRADTIVNLEPLQVRGGLFSMLQERGYWRYGKFRENLMALRHGNLSAADSAQLKWVFEQYVNHPYLDRARFDSVASKKETISYYYTQTVKVVEGDKKLQLTLDGMINGLDGSQYHLPPDDTISFNISTMLFFVDPAVRYKVKVVEKFAVVNDRNYLSFKVADSRIIDTLGDNRRQLEKIKDMMNQMMLQHDYYIDTIMLTAAASPEGSAKLNDNLARKRVEALQDYLKEQYRLPELDTLLHVRSIGENWRDMRRLVIGNGRIKEREKILEIIDNTDDLDQRENMIRNRFAADYKYLRDSIYPQLRTVDFRYNLRRIGMIKDTVHTTIVDSDYMNAVEDMRARHYGKAAEVLLNYRDQNSAVVMLSLGYNTAAYDVLFSLPETPTINYLKAIICARLGKFEEGLKYYKLACDVDESWEFRGRLDPEISSLLINEEKNDN